MKRQTTAKKNHKNESSFKLSNLKYRKEVKSIFDNALKNDLGKMGDITSDSILNAETMVLATIISRMDGTLSGLAELNWLLKANTLKSFSGVKLKVFRNDGEKVKKGTKILEITGSAKDILVLERTLLNILSRMCGVATLTNKFVQKVPKNVLVCCTRKTLWGALDKKACIVGGGGSHRLNLSDAVLIKDNHIELMDYDFDEIVKRLKRKRNVGRFLEIEVDCESMAMEVAEKFWCLSDGNYKHIPLVIMFDNMKPSSIKKTIIKLKEKGYADKFLFEASGGINIKNIAEYAKTGVDIISVGALTHSAPGFDLSMQIRKLDN